MEGILECNKCKKIIGGNCFLTKCRHILCHGDGLSGYNDDNTFTCPICNTIMDQENGVTELNFQGERISKSDVNVVLSFLVERPGASLDFLGQVIKFRDFQRQELLKHQNLLEDNHTRQVKELERTNAQYRQYVHKVESKLNDAQKNVDTLQVEMKEMKRKYDALDRTYNNLLSEHQRRGSSSSSNNTGPRLPFGGRPNPNAKSPGSIGGVFQNDFHANNSIPRRSNSNGHFDNTKHMNNNNNNNNISPYFSTSNNNHRTPPTNNNNFVNKQPLGAFHQHRRPMSGDAMNHHTNNNNQLKPRHMSSRSPGRRSRSVSPGTRMNNNNNPHHQNIPQRLVASGGSGGGKFNFRSRFAPQTPAFKRSQKIMNEFRH